MIIMPESNIILLLISTLQIIALGLLSWTLSTVVKLLQRMATLEGKFDAFPIQQISNNRHRVEQLEKHAEGVEVRLSAIEKAIAGIKHFCNTRHDGNL